MRRLIILAEVALGLLFASCTKEEQRTLSVIPAPLKVELQQEVFSLNSETGLHLHFELWHKGRAVNPELYIVF